MFSEDSIAASLSPKSLELIILPTEKCNFRCTYCYEDFSIGKMKRPVIEGIKNLISNRAPRLKILNLSWFGGEPLLAKDIIFDITQHARDLCNENHVSMHSGFTTNGYLLTQDLLSDLTNASPSSFQITLDGDKEWHDQTRLLANKKGSFDRLWGNLIAMRNSKMKFSVTLRLHLHKENIDSMRRLCHLIEKNFTSDNRFSTYFHRITDLGGGSVSASSVLTKSEYLDAISSITDVKKAGDRPISEMHLNGYICYAAKPNSIMIRADGSLGKCTVALNDPRNSVGRIKEDGSLEISNAKLQHWFSGYADLSKNTLSCPLATLSNP
jgi:uncharacterized protein